MTVGTTLGKRVTEPLGKMAKSVTSMGVDTGRFDKVFVRSSIGQELPPALVLSIHSAPGITIVTLWDEASRIGFGSEANTSPTVTAPAVGMGPSSASVVLETVTASTKGPTAI